MGGRKITKSGWELFAFLVRPKTREIMERKYFGAILFVGGIILLTLFKGRALGDTGELCIFAGGIILLIQGKKWLSSRGEKQSSLVANSEHSK